MNEIEKPTVELIAIALLSLFFIAWWPLAVVWSLNTLFQTQIPYALNTWAAVVVIVTLVRVSTISPEKR